jgi:cellulose synthase/poly-beta-1,6-N-acetylglucosamine synthase-like glycosyltransferase
VITTIGFVLFALPAILTLIAYAGYPLVLLAMRRRERAPTADPPLWPHVTVVIPVYNEERAIAKTLDNILATDYPSDRRHVLVISDASSDGTDSIVSGYRERGVELVRLPQRAGKTAAENEAGKHLVGEVVVNLDATIRVPPSAIKALVRAFTDPRVGVASGRDQSVGDLQLEGNRHESTYVGYEMWLRRLETEADGIVGASGCFYAIRKDLFDSIFPEALSRDFASPLIAREQGFRSVSVEDASCLVPRTRSLKAEYRRKIRTMTRGLETLWFKRHLLNPFRYGLFAWFLTFHKLVRWLVFLAIVPGWIGLALLAFRYDWARWLMALSAVVGGLGLVGYYWPEHRSMPRPLALVAFIVSASAAGVVAWYRALGGELDPVWEPTRRP